MNLEKYLNYQPLKALPRVGWALKGVKNPEVVASHVWGVAMLVMELAPELAPHIDQLKALKMALHHDTVEIKAGDITPHDNISDAEKHQREKAAALSLLGENSEAYVLWMEMEKLQTPEAKFVKAMDRLDMSLRAIDYVKRGDLTLASAMEFIDYAKNHFKKLDYLQLCEEVDQLIQKI